MTTAEHVENGFLSSDDLQAFAPQSVTAAPNVDSRLVLHEEDRFPLIRSLDTFTAVTKALGG
jgi:hypothetical protein